MTVRRRAAPDSDGYEQRLLALVTADSPELILSEGASLLGDLSGSPLAVAVRTDAAAVVSESWYPEPRAATRPHASRLRLLALAALQHMAPVVPRRAAADRACVWTLTAGGRTVGAVGVMLPRAYRRGSSLHRRMDRAAQFVAEALARVAHATEPRPEADEQDRLFRRLDRQVRLLDGERQKFAAIVNQSGTYMFVTDPSGSIRWTNRAMGMRWQATGVGATWIGKSCRDVCSRLASGPTPSACTSCPVARAAAHNDVMHQEFRETGDGKVHTLYLSALPIKGLDGQPQEVLVMMQDLSDLETLRESEERYRIITQAASDGIVTIGEDGVIVFANSAAERIFGYTARELIGRPLTSLMPPAMVDQHRGGFARYLETGEKRMSWEGVQVPAIHSSGRELTIEISFGEFGASGRRLFTGVIRDITERRRAEAELKRAQERLRMVVSKSPIVLFAIDRDGIFTLSEGRGLEILGLTPAEVVGRSAYDVYREAPQIVANLQKALAGEEFIDVVEVASLAFDTCYTPLRDEAGQVIGVIGVATDVTERRRLENQLLQSQKMEAVGRLAGGIAHDFNNLLTTVLGYSTLLMQSQTGVEPDKRIVEIKRAAERAAGLTRQLLAFSRKQVIQPRNTELNQVVAGMEEMLRRLIGEDIEFVFTNAPEPVLVRADPGQLEQMLMNLVVNARDAMPQGGRLDVKVAARRLDAALKIGDETVPRGQWIVLSVHDTGSGMDRETLARVFEPFYTKKERGKGTGLGLAMVHGIVQQNGGHVFVRSDVGVGTTFDIYLPRAEGVPAAGEEPKPSGRSTTGAETLLMVEDESSVRALVHELLVRQGYSVLVAGNGEEALAVAARHTGTIDLLITDVVMPGMSGGELASRFLRERPGVRVLYISGYSDDAIVRYGVSQADLAFLQKPFSYEAFVNKVREVLDRPAPPRSTAADENRAA